MFAFTGSFFLAPYPFILLFHHRHMYQMCIFHYLVKSQKLWKIMNIFDILAMWSNSTTKDVEFMKPTRILNSTQVHPPTLINPEFIYITIYFQNPKIEVECQQRCGFCLLKFRQKRSWNRSFFQKWLILQKCDAFFLHWISLQLRANDF